MDRREMLTAGFRAAARALAEGADAVRRLRAVLDPEQLARPQLRPACFPAKRPREVGPTESDP
ncbi:MAG: hypothetical protein ACE149_08180 [Armatimonadota bacterium]